MSANFSKLGPCCRSGSSLVHRLHRRRQADLGKLKWAVQSDGESPSLTFVDDCTSLIG